MEFPCLARAFGLATLPLVSPPAHGAQTVLFEFQGAAASDQFGTYLGAPGDVDGDGFAELLAASRFENATASRSPYVRLYSGRTGTLLFEWQGDPEERRFGESVGGVGDANGDGHPDIYVASPEGSTIFPVPPPRIHVFSGLDGTLLRLFEPPAGAADQGTFARAATGAGDLDGDGLADIVISTWCEANCDGRVRAYSIATGALLWTSAGSLREGLGLELEGIGDVSGDGVPDLAVTSLNGALDFSGKVSILSGATGDRLRSFEPAVPVTFETYGDSMACAGDLTGDGLDEIAIGTVSSLIEGSVEIREAATGTLVWRVEGGPFEQLGTTVSAGQDVNGDGVPDVSASGRAFARVLSGVNGTQLLEIADPGTPPDAFFGPAVLPGDTNGDGFSNLAVAGPRDNTLGANGLGTGTVYLVSRDPENGGRLCLGEPNSTGDRGTLDAVSPSGFVASANDLSLEAAGLPANVLGFAVVSQDLFILPAAGGGQGTLCIASFAMGRFSFDMLSSGASGEMVYAVDASAIPISSGGGFSFRVAAPGDTYNFQIWHRDVDGAGASTSNFTDAVTVRFL